MASNHARRCTFAYAISGKAANSLPFANDKKTSNRSYTGF
jgi:hypothetical protein